MKKPSAVGHMTVYGLIYGFLLAMIYVLIVNQISAENLSLSETIGLFALMAWVSSLAGAVPGVVLGFISGYVLHLFTYRIHIPIDVIGLRQWRNLSYFVVGSLTLAGMSCISFMMLILVFASSAPPPTRWDMLWIGVPMPIATFAAVYAVHRYFLKLRTWGSRRANA